MIIGHCGRSRPRAASLYAKAAEYQYTSILANEDPHDDLVGPNVTVLIVNNQEARKSCRTKQTKTEGSHRDAKSLTSCCLPPRV